jgi:hypothetical protein
MEAGSHLHCGILKPDPTNGMFTNIPNELTTTFSNWLETTGSYALEKTKRQPMSSTVRILIILYCAYAGSSIGAARS